MFQILVLVSEIMLVYLVRTITVCHINFIFRKKHWSEKNIHFTGTVVIWSAHWTDPDQVIRTLAGSFIVFLDEAFYSHSAPLHTGERHFIQEGGGVGIKLLLVTDSNNASCYIYTQGSYGSWKAWKVLEFYPGIIQDWKVLEKGHWPRKVLEIY